jgi:hypothetical protein
MRGRLAKRVAWLAMLVCSSGVLAQNPQLRTKNGQRFPTVVFTSVLWTMNPPYYSVAIDSTGASTYQSAPDSVDRTGVPYTIEFQAGNATRTTIFSITQNLNFLSGEFPTTLGFPANTPVRTLGYHDTTFNNQITYSQSSDSQIQALTSVFEEISATLEFGRRLAYLRQHDQNALDAELASMEKESRRHLLRELQAVAPVLRSIAGDNSLAQTVRVRAGTLLKASSISNATQAQPPAR